jgi:hypothetical protein
LEALGAVAEVAARHRRLRRHTEVLEACAVDGEGGAATGRA